MTGKQTAVFGLYENRDQEKGGVLLSAHCDTDGETLRAKELIAQTGGKHISSTGEASADVPGASRAVTV